MQPREPETYGIAHESMLKPAALLFDKIRHHPEIAKDEGVPVGMTFMLERAEATISPLTMLIDITNELKSRGTRDFPARVMNLHVKKLVKSYAACGIEATPLYATEKQFARDFVEGRAVAYQAIMNNIPVVTPTLEWKQIAEFRHDRKAVRRYRALRNWLRDALQSKSVEEATDLIAARIHEYEWAIKKHGLETRLGTVKAILQSPTIAAVTTVGGVAALLDRPLWALLAAGALTISTVAVAAGERRLAAEDLEERNAPVALIYDIRRTLDGA